MHEPRPTDRAVTAGTTGEAGYALVSVLWMVTLLTILTASYHASARREARTLVQSVYDTQARAHAEAAIWIAARDLLPERRRDVKPRSTMTVTFDGTPVDVTLVEITGRINLNRAGEDVLARLLAGAGVAEGENAELVDAIQDWRDSDGTARPHGAEDPDYAALGHGANDSPFATVDELRHVRGMTDAIFRRIEGQLTVFGNQSGVNAEAAGEDVLLSLSGGDSQSVDAYLRDRATDDAAKPLQLDGIGNAWAPNVRSDVYTVTSTATAAGGEATVEATIRLPQRGRDGVLVFAWN